VVFPFDLWKPLLEILGGTLSHEFQVLADTGEDAILACKKCDYAANMEKAEIQKATLSSERKIESLERVHTPGKKTVEEVTSFLNKKPHEIIKTLIYFTPKGFVAACVRGDHEVNENKLMKFADVDHLHLASAEETQKVSKSPVGFVGPIGWKAKVFVDQAIDSNLSYVCGANEKDYHYINVSLGRDFKATLQGDLRCAQAGDLCVRCGEELKLVRGIEVGQVFYLGTKYSQAMKAVFLNAKGKETPMVMGCYGIGIGRTIAAAIEQNHDEKGIVFPMALAPFQVIILGLSAGDDEVSETCEQLYMDMRKKGIEVLYDDRDERAGIKFNDADLLGIPLQVIIGKKSLKEKMVEIKERRSGQMEKISSTKVVQVLQERISAALHKSA